MQRSNGNNKGLLRDKGSPPTSTIVHHHHHHHQPPSNTSIKIDLQFSSDSGSSSDSDSSQSNVGAFLRARAPPRRICTCCATTATAAAFRRASRPARHRGLNRIQQRPSRSTFGKLRTWWQSVPRK